jgi:hypothetical protein
VATTLADVLQLRTNGVLRIAASGRLPAGTFLQHSLRQLLLHPITAGMTIGWK